MCRFSLIQWWSDTALESNAWDLSSSSVCSSSLHSYLTTLVLSGIWRGSNDHKCFSNLTGIPHQHDLIQIWWPSEIQEGIQRTRLFLFLDCHCIADHRCCNQSIITTVLVINDKYTLPVKYAITPLYILPVLMPSLLMPICYILPVLMPFAVC